MRRRGRNGNHCDTSQAAINTAGIGQRGDGSPQRRSDGKCPAIAMPSRAPAIVPMVLVRMSSRELSRPGTHAWIVSSVKDRAAPNAASAIHRPAVLDPFHHPRTPSTPSGR